MFDSIDIHWRPLARTLALRGKMNPVGGNGIEIFTDGRTKFEAFNRDLQSAERFIDMEYYRFAADTIAGVVKNILMDKAEEGVSVRMILESRSNSPKASFYKQLRKPRRRWRPRQGRGRRRTSQLLWQNWPPGSAVRLLS